MCARPISHETSNRAGSFARIGDPTMAETVISLMVQFISTDTSHHLIEDLSCAVWTVPEDPLGCQRV